MYEMCHAGWDQLCIRIVIGRSCYALFAEGMDLFLFALKVQVVPGAASPWMDSQC